MKRKIGIIMLVMAVALLIALPALAGPGKWGGRGSGGWGPGTPYHRLYDPAQEVVVTGVVESVQKRIPLRGMSEGLAILVKGDSDTIEVHLGPAWYLERLDEKISKGDKVEVKGVKATLAGKPIVIAAEVKKEDKVLILRDNAGIPVWAGWRGRR